MNQRIDQIILGEKIIMKAVLLAPTPPPAGGIAGWTARMMNAVLKNGWKLQVVDEKVIGKRGVFGTQDKRNYFTEVIRCMKIWGELFKTLHDKDVKVVHSCIPSLPLAMIREYICAIITKLYGRKFVVHFRCTVPNTTKGRISNKILKKLCKKADLIICLNSQSENFLIKITKTPTIIIPNFIEMRELEEEHEIRETIKKAIYVGGVVEDKGVIDLIEVAKHYPNIVFEIVGDGDISIKEAAEKDNVRNVVFTGVKERLEVKQKLKDSDIFIFLTYFYGEGFSNALCEAMAMGLPCIVTDWAANKDMIGEKGGVVVDVHDIEGVVAAISGMQYKSVREAMSRANIRKVKEEYLDQVVIDQYVDAYESLLAK